MKQLVFFLLLFFSFSLNAQVEYGTITYTRVTEMNVSSEAIDDKAMKEMMEQMAAAGAFTVNFKATFTPDGFTFAEEIKEKTSVESEMGGGTIVVMETGGGEPTIYHTNIKTGEVTNRDFILDKGFLVEGTEEPLEWNLTDEVVAPSEATVGLDLKIATAVTPGGDTITAGYAPSLPVQVGPNNYFGLPGAIITLSKSNTGGGNTVYRATSLSLSAEPLMLEKPTEGKKVTPEEFRSEQAKRNKMLERQFRH